MNWTQVLIATAAIGAFILSIYSFIIKQKEKGPKIKVKIQTHMLAYGPKPSPPMVALTAYNVGTQPVFLSSHGFKLPDGQTLFFPNPQADVSFPHELLPGKNCNVRVEYKILAQELARHKHGGTVKLVGLYGDSADNTYTSKPWKFNVEKELESKA